MAFDIKKFTKTKWTPRTEDVPVPDMQAFFQEGEPAVWRVRGSQDKSWDNLMKQRKTAQYSGGSLWDCVRRGKRNCRIN